MHYHIYFHVTEQIVATDASTTVVLKDGVAALCKPLIRNMFVGM